MVMVNNNLNQVTWEQCVMSGDLKFSDAQDVVVFLCERMLTAAPMKAGQPSKRQTPVELICVRVESAVVDLCNYRRIT